MLAQIGTEANTAALSVVTVAQINTIVLAITGALAANEADYQAYIDANVPVFGTPATAAEVQAMVTEAEITADTISATTNVIDNVTGFSNFLKIPAPGFHLRTNGTLINVNSAGILWSRSANGGNGRYLFTDSGEATFYSNSRSFGFSVRCIKD
ncbi:hypothetical protein [Candidatus Thioglobus sp.]|uniref:hypothetical protein n=1 Tax=Candidatus Thioglobus sp. TaxID=2026721 RepID=UPI003D14F1F1